MGVLGRGRGRGWEGYVREYGKDMYREGGEEKEGRCIGRIVKGKGGWAREE